MSINSSPSNFIINQNPEMYGGKQERYVEAKKAAIQSGLKLLENAREEKKNFRELFFDIFNLFAAARHTIAVSGKTENAELFGRNRMDCSDDVAVTGMAGVYEKFNQRMIRTLQEVLKGKIPLKDPLKEKKFTVEGSCLNRKCSFEIELLTNNDLVQRFDSMKVSCNQYGSKLSAPNVDLKNYPPTPTEREGLNKFNAQFLDFKIAYPQAYDTTRLHFVYEGIQNFFPSHENVYDAKKNLVGTRKIPQSFKSIFIVAKTFIEIDKKMHALSEFVTWTYRDFTTDPVDRMKTSTIVIVHQDRFLIDPTLTEISKIFEKALSWNDQHSLTELKDDTALIRYLFAHSMPSARGSAAEAEWLEEFLYEAHGFSCTHLSDTLGDMEAFVAPLWSTFRTQLYDKTIELKKVE